MIRPCLFALVFTATACRPSSPPAAVSPGELVDPSTVATDFMMRQHLQGDYGDDEIAFDAVVQKQGDTLLVLVLTPYGSRALLIEQKGLNTRVEKFVPQELPFDPRFVLLDVQRVFIKGITDTPKKDGWRTMKLDGETLRERWAGGRLVERRFRRSDRRVRGEVTVRYDGGWVPGEPPPEIELVNEWFGYRLSLRTDQYDRL